MNRLCVIIPCFNEEKRLNPQLFEKFINSNKTIDIFFSDDGSKDKTYDIINSLALKFKDRIRVIRLEKNSGKSEAIRQAVMVLSKEKEYDYIGYLDADLSTPLTEMGKIFDYTIAHNEYDMVMGSRIKRLGTEIRRSLLRHYFGRVFATFASMMLGLPVYDTQCGAKIFKAEISGKIFEKKFYSRWIFDIEILYRYMQFSKEVLIYEFPLTVWIDIGKSKIKPLYILKLPFEMLKIYLIYKRKSEKKLI